ncbi:MAG: DUF485 domain-containing protein [Yaniella sp.]|nr:DUF485 domain-containing protein [Yaniella sp.]
MTRRRQPEDDIPEDDLPADDDFVLDLIREPEAPQEVPESIRAMRARRVEVHMPTGAPSVKEVLLNPAEPSGSAQSSRRMLQRLMRAQLRLGVTLISWFFGLVVVVNIAFHFSPGLASFTIASVPLEWLIPAGVFIPLLIFLGWFYVRRATANEQALEPQPTQEVHQ